MTVITELNFKPYGIFKFFGPLRAEVQTRLHWTLYIKEWTIFLADKQQKWLLTD